MRRAFLLSLTFMALGCIAGCGGGNILNSSSGTNPGSFPLTALNGQYAFVLAGFDPSGNPVGIAGSLKANGAGLITGGAVDVNDNGTVYSSSALAGTYAFDSIGQIPIGKIVLTNAVTTSASVSLPHTLAFGFALQTSGVVGDIMDLSANNFVVAGTMQQQASSAFSLTSLAGDYAITLNGRSSSNPTSVLGRFTLDSNGQSTSILFDRSVAGTGSASSTSGTVAFTTPDANGRGTLTVNITDPLFGSTAQTFSFYAVNTTSPGRFIAVENDATGVMTADASRQSTPFTTTTVNTAGAVFGMSGVDTTVANEITAVGQLQIASQTTAALAWDSNDNGVFDTTLTLPGQSATFDPTTGRGTVTVAGGTGSGLANNLVFYLTGSGNGFIMDQTSGSTNRALAGTLTAQAGSLSTTTDLAGQAIVRARGSAVKDAQSFVGVFAPVTNPTGYAFAFDQGVIGGAAADQQTSVFTVPSLSSTTGRGTLVTSDETIAFYVIGVNQFVFIDITPGTSSSPATSSPVFFASPE